MRVWGFVVLGVCVWAVVAFGCAMLAVAVWCACLLSCAWCACRRVSVVACVLPGC